MSSRGGAEHGAAPVGAGELDAGSRGDLGSARSGSRRHRGLWFGLALLGGMVLAATFAPVLAPADPLRQDLSAALAPPSMAHPLGTDRLGRDLLSRLLHGARLSLGIGAAAVSASLAIGVLLGAMAGNAGRAVDETILRVTDVVLAFPGLLLAVALASVLGPSAHNTVIALAAMGWPGYARLVRAEVRGAAALDYARAAEALGARPIRVALLPLLPAARGALVVQATFGLSGAIVAEAGLSFLGLGPPPPAPSWGAMLAEGRSLLVVAPGLTLIPAAAIFLTVLAINLVGDALASPGRPGRSPRQR